MPTCNDTGEPLDYRDGWYWHTRGSPSVCRMINRAEKPERGPEVATQDYQEVLCDTCPVSNPTVERRPVGTKGLPDGWTLSYQGPEVDGQSPPPGAWLEHCPKCSERIADARRRRETPGRKSKA